MTKTNKNEITQKLESAIRSIENGDVFGLWVVLNIHGKASKYGRYCIAECKCGTVKEVRIDSLISGKSKSCGCQLSSLAKTAFTTHNQSHSRLYSIFNGMKQRCYNKNHNSYHNYGARGIIICEEWLNNFGKFYTWAINNGYKDDLTIDRIDVDRNYEPDNCQWITLQEQQLNKNNTVYVEYQGNNISLIKLLSDLGRLEDKKIITERIRNGIPVDIAISLKDKEDVFKYRFKEKIMSKLPSLQEKEISLTKLAKEIGVSRSVLIRWYKDDIDIVEFLNENGIAIKKDGRSK